MANESKQVNYSNFEFFKLDSMSLPEITVGSDAYGSLLNPELNAEDNTEQTTFETPEMPEASVSETIQAPIVEEQPESPEVIFEQLDQQEQNEVPITTEDLLPVIEDPQEQLVVDDLLPVIEDPQEPLAIDDLLPQIEDPQEKLLAIDDILPPLDDKQEEPLVVTDLLPDINDNVQEPLDVSELLPLIETEKEEVLSVSDMLPEENISSEESIIPLNEYNFEIPEKEESNNISDLLDPIEVQQEEQQRISDLINESTEIIYNTKSSLEIKIKELEAKFTKMDTEALPGFKAAVTAALNMDRDRPINIKPGYSDDIGTFLTKINSPPSWRAMSN